MRPEVPRRTVLAASAATLGPALAGCGGDQDDDAESTSDPDEGTDSYGIRLENDAEDAHQVYLKATYIWEDETPFEETVEIEPGETRTWNGVITEEVEHNVVAHLNEGEQMRQKASRFVTPGQEDSPDVANVEVLVHEYERETEDGEVELIPIIGMFFPD